MLESDSGQPSPLRAQGGAAQRASRGQAASLQRSARTSRGAAVAPATRPRLPRSAGVCRLLSVRSRTIGRTSLPSDCLPQLRPRPSGRGGNGRPSARRRETAYASYPGCRHGHVTNPLRQRGHAGLAPYEPQPSTFPFHRGGVGCVRTRAPARRLESPRFVRRTRTPSPPRPSWDCSSLLGSRNASRSWLSPRAAKWRRSLSLRS